MLWAEGIRVNAVAPGGDRYEHVNFAKNQAGASHAWDAGLETNRETEECR